VTPEEYDERFRKWVGRYVGGWKLVPRWSNKTLRKQTVRLEEEPSDLDALLTVAWAHYQRGNRIDAMSHLGRALEIDPKSPRALLLRGELAFGAKRTDKAREWYEQFLATGEDDLFARIRLAQILEGTREFEAAMEQYEAAKACFPSYAGPKNPYLELARLKEGEENLEGAMSELESYVKLANTDIDHRMKLADWYASEGSIDRLIDVLEQVVMIYPLGEKLAMPVHVRLARAYSEWGDHELAELEYEVALELGVPPEEEAEVRVALGETYFLRGKVRQARFQAETAIELDPGNERARELLEKASE
jgi:tetratricopeptide (TPR) repeat protein